MNFYRSFVRLCNSVNKSPSAVLLEIGLSKSLNTRWKEGKGMTDASAIRIADYFGIPVEELTKEETPDTDGAERDEGNAKIKEINLLLPRLTEEELDDLIADVKRTILGQ